MRLAILSDIHANLEALCVALDNVDSLVVDGILCLGDVVGYGPSPNECVEVLINRGIKCIRGNHDEAALDLEEARNFNPYARRAVEWTHKMLSEQSKEFLEALEYHYEPGTFQAVHGALTHPFHYISNSGAAMVNFHKMEKNILFVGHSHAAECYIDKGEKAEFRDLIYGGEIFIKPESRYIINCGSVGQPRDSNPEAAFVIFDSGRNMVKLFRQPYPLDITQRKMRIAGLPGYLIDRLAFGR